MKWSSLFRTFFFPFLGFKDCPHYFFSSLIVVFLVKELRIFVVCMKEPPNLISNTWAVIWICCVSVNSRSMTSPLFIPLNPEPTRSFFCSFEDILDSSLSLLSTDPQESRDPVQRSPCKAHFNWLTSGPSLLPPALLHQRCILVSLSSIPVFPGGC